MRWAGTVIREVYALFVDDGSFAAAIVAWLIVILLALKRLNLTSGWSAVALFVGLAIIFIDSAMRRARLEPDR